jgi:hypothetical protein
MLISTIAVVLVVIGIVAYIYVFNKVRGTSSVSELIDEAAEAGKEKEEQDKPTEIFKAVDEVSNTQDVTAAYDSGNGVTANVTFTEKIGKDTVVVELPSKKKAVKKSAKKTEAKKAEPKKPATPGEVLEVIDRKIARRKNLLKVAGVPERNDKVLAKLESKRQELVVADASAKAAELKASAKKDEPKAEPAKKTTKKATTKKAPAKKPAKKPTKKAAKKTSSKKSKK